MKEKRSIKEVEAEFEKRFQDASNLMNTIKEEYDKWRASINKPTQKDLIKALTGIGMYTKYVNNDTSGYGTGEQCFTFSEMTDFIDVYIEEDCVIIRGGNYMEYDYEYTKDVIRTVLSDIYKRVTARVRTQKTRYNRVCALQKKVLDKIKSCKPVLKKDKGRLKPN